MTKSVMMKSHMEESEKDDFNDEESDGDEFCWRAWITKSHVEEFDDEETDVTNFRASPTLQPLSFHQSSIYFSAVKQLQFLIRFITGVLWINSG